MKAAQHPLRGFSYLGCFADGAPFTRMANRFRSETKTDIFLLKRDTFPLDLQPAPAVSPPWAGCRNKRERWQAQKYRADEGAIYEPPLNAAG